MYRRTFFTALAVLGFSSLTSAAPPSVTETPAPASIKKTTPQGSKSGRFLTVNYGVPGGKILLHAFTIGSGEAATGYIDVIAPSGKRIQRFELEFPAPAQKSAAYKVTALWMAPGKQKLPMVLLEGADDHLVLVFPKGFGFAGSMQLFSELAEDGRRETTFDELDKRGLRMVRIDVDEPENGDKPAHKETLYYVWGANKFVERKQK